MAEKVFYGLLGYPVKHSLSPIMHNSAFKALGIPAEYKLFEREPYQVESFLKSLAKQNILGLNVTIPYKEVVIRYLDRLSPQAKFTGAVNVIVAEGEYLKGYNTDGSGFLRHLTQDLGFEPQGKRAVVLGAGGASKAVVNQLALNKIKSIGIYDIDRKRAETLVEKLNKEFSFCEAQLISCLEDLDLTEVSLLVNATPVGMKGEPSLIKREKLHSQLLVYDLIYNPPQTELLKIAQERGARVSNGLGMLLYQGAESFELWTQKPAPVEVMRKALEEAIKEL